MTDNRVPAMPHAVSAELKLIPREPTEAMIEAAADSVETWVTSSTGVDAHALSMIGRAMWDAAPTVPASDIDGRDMVREHLEQLANWAERSAAYTDRMDLPRRPMDQSQVFHMQSEARQALKALDAISPAIPTDLEERTRKLLATELRHLGQNKDATWIETCSTPAITEQAALRAIKRALTLPTTADPARVREALRACVDSLAELTEYEGGADNALEDEYVLNRACEAQVKGLEALSLIEDKSDE